MLQKVFLTLRSYSFYILGKSTIIRETVDESNVEVVAAIYAMAEQVVQAVREKDTTVKIGEKVLAQSVNRTNSNSGYISDYRPHKRSSRIFYRLLLIQISYKLIYPT